MGRSHDLATGVSYQDQTETDARYHTKTASDAAYANVSGDTFTGQLIAANSLQVGDASINQQYTNLGYVADFQASSGGQTYISIAEPGASSLGDNGVVIGEDTNNAYITQRGNKPINIATSDLNRIIVDGSGRVTMPYQPSFRAESSGGISTGAGVSTLVLPSVQHNIGNHYNSSNYTFTCPVAGIYFFGFHGNVRDVGSSQAGSLYAQIMKNGSRQAIYYTSDEPNAAWHLCSGSIILSCAAGDAILVSSGAHAYWDSSGWTQFYGHLLG